MFEYKKLQKDSDNEKAFMHIRPLFGAGTRKAPFFTDLSKDWYTAGKMVKPYVLNYERNRKVLEKGRYTYNRELDLAVVYYLELPVNEAVLSYQVTEDMRRSWGVTKEELQAQSIQNATYQIKTLGEVVNGGIFSMSEEEKRQSGNWYVLSNQEVVRGAAGMLFGSCLREKAWKEQCNFYILPSSIHEVLLIRDEGRKDMAGLLKIIVEQVNSDRSLVPEEMYLSDSVYYYDRETESIQIAA